MCGGKEKTCDGRGVGVRARGWGEERKKEMTVDFCLQ